MSTVSKIPRNRGSRIAAPSKLPSRIMRPTYAKNSSLATNFVSSAKHMERKKEGGRHADSSEESMKVSSSKEVQRGVLEKDMDCNHNKQEFANTNSSSENDLLSIAALAKNQQVPEKYYEIQLPNVNTASKSDSKNFSPTDSNTVELPSSRRNTTAPNFRLMKPGYFAQKAYAIKDSQQKRIENATTKQLSYDSRCEQPSSSLRAGHRGALLSGIEEKDGFKTATADCALSSRYTRHTPQPASSRISHTTISQSNGSQAAFSYHPEKRKKYLEVRTTLQAANAPRLLQNDTASSEERTKGDAKTNCQTDHTSRRQYLRRPPPRSAKIARPVIRPKKSPLTPKPYTSQHAESSNGNVQPSMHPRRLGGLQDDEFCHFNQHSDEGKEPNQSVGSESPAKPICSHAVASEESGCGHTASAVYLDTRVATVENNVLQSADMCAQSTRSHLTGRSKNGILLNGCSSNSTSDVLTPEFNNEHEHDMNLFAISHGPSQVEEDYLLGVPQKICAISSDVNNVRDVQSSPDYEITSESSLETVISNAPSPNLLDRPDNKVDTDEDQPERYYDGSDSSRDISCDHTTRDLGECNEFQHLNLVNGNFCTIAVSTPKSLLCSDQTSATSSLYSEVCKTGPHSLTFVISDKNDSLETEMQDAESLGRILFPDALRQSKDNCELSELDLPSLHESALMADYDSLTEDECNSRADLEDHSVTDGKVSGSPGSGSTAIDVINKLLCEGLDGISGRQDESVLDNEFLPLSNEYQYTEGLEVANGAAIFSCPNDDVTAVTEPTALQPNYDQLLTEVGMMKTLLLQLQGALELGEVERKRQVEENKKLVVMNGELARMVESATQDLESRKTTKAEPTVTDKEVQVDDERSTATVDENMPKFMVESDETLPTPRRFVSELSEEMGPTVRKAFEEIQSLKDIRADFDRRINRAEHHIVCILQLFER